MGEIKFRGIYIDTGEFVYGYLVNQRDDKAVIFDPNEGIGTYYVVKKETVGQFTGLPDKNGKEKYHGDIVRSGNGRIWETKQGHWKMAMPGTYIKLYGWYMQDGECQQPIDSGDEIIGNIHENPDLLK